MVLLPPNTLHLPLMPFPLSPCDRDVTRELCASTTSILDDIRVGGWVRSTHLRRALREGRKPESWRKAARKAPGLRCFSCLRLWSLLPPPEQEEGTVLKPKWQPLGCVQSLLPGVPFLSPGNPRMLHSPCGKGQLFLQTPSWMASEVFPELKADSNNYNSISRPPNVWVMGSGLTSDLCEEKWGAIIHSTTNSLLKERPQTKTKPVFRSHQQRQHF